MADGPEAVLSWPLFGSGYGVESLFGDKKE